MAICLVILNTFFCKYLTQTSSTDQKDTYLTELYDGTFQQFFQDHSNYIVVTLYYAPWCYWSQLIMNEYVEAAKLSHAHYKEVFFTRVNAHKEIAVAEIEAIREYPTLRMYINSRVENYTGRRSRSDLIKWVETVSNRNKNITTEDQIDQLIRNVYDNHVVILASFPPNHNKTAYKLAAKTLGSSTLFGEIESQKLVDYLFKTYLINKRTSPIAIPFIIAFSAFEKSSGPPDIDMFTGNNTDTNSIEKFVKMNHLPDLIPMIETWIDALFSDGRAILLYIYDSSYEESKVDNAFSSLRNIAPEYKSDIIFTYMKNENRLERSLINQLAVEEETLPLVRVIKQPNYHGHSNQFLKYKPSDSKLDDQTIRTFLDSFVKGNVKPYVKSEIPLDPGLSDDPVLVLVGDNFDEIARDPKMDVFVMFHAPWCGHCRELLPIVTEVARLVKNVNHLVIAKIDATLNEIFDIYLRGYPTMMLFPAKVNANPIVYNDKWSVKHILTWLSSKTLVASFDAYKALQQVDTSIREVIQDEEL